ncbi:unnamed protein product [Paramecium pentaurelia]|uniref:Uncharacterized protein n=1 Tax=Paramecium pentaurelia TaxID=43138 RepID=A0A8S1XWF0_9CILI|nr:unnamed protein product [Paramecium pentaurelia]
MQKLKDSTDEISAKYKLLRLALILEKQALKTPLNILKIYTNIKWRFNKTTDFVYQSNQWNEIRRNPHSQSSPNMLKKSLKHVVKEVQIKNYTERVHRSQIEGRRTSQEMEQLVELARVNSSKRNLQKKSVDLTKDVYQNIYEFGLLFILFGFIWSMYYVISQQLKKQ